MNDAVSHALYGRGQEADGLSRMVAISGGAHVVLLAAMLFIPATWFRAAVPDTREVMTISLSGTSGPTTQGMTPIGGRAVQKAVAEPPKIQPIRPPAARTPEMVEPVKTAPKPEVKPSSAVKEAPKESRSRTPTQGAETRPGRALAETGSQANTLGLTTGGGMGTGGQITLGDFCCPQYVGEMVRLIRESWNQNQQATGTTILKFTIQRDGSIANLGVEQSSGFQMLDMFAQRAMLTVKLPPLPPEYTNPTLTVNLAFDYHR